MKDSDERYTPPWLVAVIREFFGSPFGDVATAPSNPVGAEYFRTERGLERPWYPRTWCNPPYSRGEVLKWSAKAIAEATVGMEILFLTQADVSTGWFRLLRENADAVCFLHRRVGFLMPDGTPMKGAKFGSAVWYFGRRRQRFGEVWGEHGWVVPLPGPGE